MNKGAYVFKTEIGEYKGNKTISIVNGDRRIISFGLNKAKAIVACIDEIRKFSESTENGSIDFDSLSEEQKKVIMQFISR